MNYRHAFHAGNHAEVLKHVLLLACLAHLARKPAAFAVLDTHAGRGGYDLESAEARRANEWREAAGRIWDSADAPELVATYRAALAAANPDGALHFYPGSPLLIRAALREGDHLIACEMHPEDGAALKARFRGDAQAQIHAPRDGWEALRALLPLQPRRGLVLIDPPYEEEGEVKKAARALGEAVARFETATFLWWRPLKDARALDAADAEARQYFTRPALRADLAVATPQKDGALAASSVLIVNPPFGLAARAEAALAWLCARLKIGGGAAWRVQER